MADRKLQVKYGHREVLSEIDKRFIKLLKGSISSSPSCVEKAGSFEVGEKVCVKLESWSKYYIGEITRFSNETGYNIILEKVSLYTAASCVALSHSEIQCSSIVGKGHNYFIQVMVVNQLGPVSV